MLGCFSVFSCLFSLKKPCKSQNSIPQGDDELFTNGNSGAFIDADEDI